MIKGGSPYQTVEGIQSILGDAKGKEETSNQGRW